MTRVLGGGHSFYNVILLYDSTQITNWRKTTERKFIPTQTSTTFGVAITSYCNNSRKLIPTQIYPLPSYLLHLPHNSAMPMMRFPQQSRKSS